MQWEFWKSKTFWTAAICAVAGLGFFLTGKLDFVDMAKIEAVCTMITFLRHGIAKAQM
jgi:hypothetical protein